MTNQLDMILVSALVLGVVKIGLSVMYKSHEERPFEKLPLMVDPNDRPGLERNLAELKIRKKETERYLLILGIIGPLCAGIATVAIGFFYIYKVSTNWTWILAGIIVSGFGLPMMLDNLKKTLELTIERIHQRIQNGPGIGSDRP